MDDKLKCSHKNRGKQSLVVVATLLCFSLGVFLRSRGASEPNWMARSPVLYTWPQQSPKWPTVPFERTQPKPEELTCSDGHKQNNLVFRFVMKFSPYNTNHWFHIAECITALHAGHQRHVFESTKPTDVFLVFDNVEHLHTMTPFTRMLATLGLTSTATQRFHFVTGSVTLHENDTLVLVDDLSHSFVVDFAAQSESERFVTSAASSRSKPGSSPVCGAWGGEVGRVGLHRGQWFPREENVESFRNLSRHVCSLPRFDKRDQNTVLVFQRDQNRRLLSVKQLTASLSSVLRDVLPGDDTWHSRLIVHSDSSPPCPLLRILTSTRALVTPHGFQSTLTLFLPPQSLLFEVFPFGYFKSSYGLLAREMGVHHAWQVSNRPQPTNIASCFAGSEPSLLCSLSQFTAATISRLKFIVIDLIGASRCMGHFYCRSIARRSDVTWSSEVLAGVATHLENTQIA